MVLLEILALTQFKRFKRSRFGKPIVELVHRIDPDATGANLGNTTTDGANLDSTAVPTLKPVPKTRIPVISLLVFLLFTIFKVVYFFQILMFWNPFIIMKNLLYSNIIITLKSWFIHLNYLPLILANLLLILGKSCGGVLLFLKAASKASLGNCLGLALLNAILFTSFSF